MNIHFSQEAFNIENGQRKKLKTAFVSLLEQSSLSFIIPFSLKKFYGVIAAEEKNSELFISYLKNLIDKINKNCNESKQDFILITNNASVHKSGKVKKILENNKASLLTICSYSLGLNPVKPYISCIKA